MSKSILQETADIIMQQLKELDDAKDPKTIDAQIKKSHAKVALTGRVIEIAKLSIQAEEVKDRIKKDIPLIGN